MKKDTLIQTENKYGKGGIAICAKSLDSWLALRTNLDTGKREIVCKRFMVDFGRLNADAKAAGFEVGNPNKDGLMGLKLTYKAKGNATFALRLARLCQELMKIEKLAEQVGYVIPFEIPEKDYKAICDAELRAKGIVETATDEAAAELGEVETPEETPEAVETE
jgi:hypothetical protein